MDDRLQPHEKDQIVNWFEALPNEERRLIASLVQGQFSVETACILFDEGLRELGRGQVHPLNPQEPARECEILLTVSALADLGAFGRGTDKVSKIIASIPSRIHASSCYRLPRENAFVLKEQLLRIIFVVAVDEKRITVMAIANATIDPLGKIWRYFTQSKAEDLLKSGELYFRRADLLTGDPYACRLPARVVEQRKRELESMFPGKSGNFEGGFEVSRQSTYVCCWTMREHESYLAWKHYCQEKTQHGLFEEGGFVLQTTQRRMTHLHAALRTSNDVYLRQVGYLDHWEDDIPSHDIGEEVFWKAFWFSDEKELRLALLRPFSWSNSAQWEKPPLPEGERIEQYEK